MSSWTPAAIPDLTGRTAVVTGANSGIGYVTARELARRGAHVVLACRDTAKGQAALDRLRGEAPDASAELRALDLADLASVRSFADGLATGGLDLLVNNAGVMALPLRRTADGFEMQFGTNHLGHFALTGLLLDRLLGRPGARVVTVSSTAHKIGRIDFDNLDASGGYRRWPAYGQSKLANLLFAFELDRRARSAGAALVSTAAHPGYAATNLQGAGYTMSGNRLMKLLTDLGNAVVAQDAEHGAWPTLRAATDPQAGGGEFFGPSRLFESRGAPKLVKARPAAYDEVTARRLWEVSASLTGVDYAALGG